MTIGMNGSDCFHNICGDDASVLETHYSITIKQSNNPLFDHHLNEEDTLYQNDRHTTPPPPPYPPVYSHNSSSDEEFYIENRKPFAFHVRGSDDDQQSSCSGGSFFEVMPASGTCFKKSFTAAIPTKDWRLYSVKFQSIDVSRR
jgi:hypothetical protein